MRARKGEGGVGWEERERGRGERERRERIKRKDGVGKRETDRQTDRQRESVLDQTYEC